MPLSGSKFRLAKSQGPEYGETSSNNSLLSHRVSVNDSECLRNSSVYSIHAHTLSVRDDQYDTGTKVLTLTKNTGEMRRKVSEFEIKFGMTQAYGCIDGTHIPLKRHPQN